MDFIRAIIVLLGIISTAVNNEAQLHSLTYIYTALSKPVDLPGIHEFTAMGLLDDRMIDYYDSKIQKKIPKQDWMKERLEPDYWTKGTTSRKSKEQWFKVNVKILIDRMRQVNDTELHVLQWSHGCEVEIQPDNSKKFIKGIDHYSYDGKDFLSFDDANMRWIAPVKEAIPTKTKWDKVQILNQYTKGYLQKECVDWLDKFVTYGNGQLKKASPPEVHVFANAARNPGNVLLVCMATGFYPKDVVLRIRKNKRILDEMDGVESTGVRPNEDDTYQIRTSVEIRKDDEGDYDCFVYHSSLEKPIVKEWDKECRSCKKEIISAAAITAACAFLILFVVAVIAFVLHRRGIIDLDCRRRTRLLQKLNHLPELDCQRGAQPKPQADAQVIVPCPLPGSIDEQSGLLEDPKAEHGSSDSGRGSTGGLTSGSTEDGSVSTLSSIGSTVSVAEGSELLGSEAQGSVDEQSGLLEDPKAQGSMPRPLPGNIEEQSGLLENPKA